MTSTADAEHTRFGEMSDICEYLERLTEEAFNYTMVSMALGARVNIVSRTMNSDC